MKTRNAFLGAALSMTILGGLPAAAAVLPHDIVTVGTVQTFGGAVDVPVFINDLSGTPLGLDQPPGSRIQSYSIKVNYSPASAVSSISFTRAGITAPLTPLLELSPASQIGRAHV